MENKSKINADKIRHAKLLLEEVRDSLLDDESSDNSKDANRVMNAIDAICNFGN